MPRVHFVKSARKDHPGGIKKGESYYWWKFRYGPRRTSKTKPRRSQLTQSGFLAELWDLEDEIAEMEEANEATIDEIIDRINSLSEQCEDSLSAMPDHLQDTSESGMMLQERIDALEEWSNELQSFDLDEIDPSELPGMILEAESDIP